MDINKINNIGIEEFSKQIYLELGNLTCKDINELSILLKDLSKYMAFFGIKDLEEMIKTSI